MADHDDDDDVLLTTASRRAAQRSVCVNGTLWFQKMLFISVFVIGQNLIC